MYGNCTATTKWVHSQSPFDPTSSRIRQCASLRNSFIMEEGTSIIRECRTQLRHSSIWSDLPWAQLWKLLKSDRPIPSPPLPIPPFPTFFVILYLYIFVLYFCQIMFKTADEPVILSVTIWYQLLVLHCAVFMFMYYHHWSPFINALSTVHAHMSCIVLCHIRSVAHSVDTA